jgi:hypothetical protein
MRRSSVLLIFLLCLVFVFGSLPGCDNKGTESHEQSGPFTIDRYPAAIGTQLVYLVTDTISGASDTITAKIVDTTLLFGKEPASTWIYSLSRYGFVEFVSKVGDSLKFYRDRSGIPHRILVFPLETDKHWSVPVSAGNDSCYIATHENLATPAGLFETYRIDTRLNPLALDVISDSYLWAAPRTGLVQMHLITGFRVIEHYEIWQLIEYHIPS